MENYLLGDYVKEYRQSRGLSLRDFGKLCGISHTTIDCIEKGYDPRTKKPVNITNSTFSKLSTAIGIPAHVLVGLSLGNDDFLRVPGGWASRSFLAAKVAEGKSTAGISEVVGKKEEPTPGTEDGLDPELVALIKRIPTDRMPEVERYLRFQAGQEEKP